MFIEIFRDGMHLMEPIEIRDQDVEAFNEILTKNGHGVKQYRPHGMCPDCGGYDGEHLRASCNE